MKIGQAIYAIIDNPDLSITGECDGIKYEIYSVLGKIEYVVTKTEERDYKKVWGGLPVITVLKNIDWEIKYPPVTFMEAVASGKPIKAEHKNLSALYAINDGRIRIDGYCNLGYLLKIISLYFTVEQIQEILTEGKFYTEEEN